MLKFFLFTLFLKTINCFEFSYSRFNNLIHEKKIKKVFDEIVEDKNKIKLINNPNQNWCSSCIKYYFLHNNIDFDIISYNNFYNNNFDYNKEIIFIPDFMIKYGRTLTVNEKHKIDNYNQKPNIIFNVNDYNNLVLKDNQFISKYKMFYFPELCKIQIQNYILNLIEYYQYDYHLSLINWKKFDIDKLSFEKIEDLVYELHLLMMKDFNSSICEDYIQNRLSYLYKKYYD